MLRDCPTTSGPDKKIIYDQHRTDRRGGSNSNNFNERKTFGQQKSASSENHVISESHLKCVPNSNFLSKNEPKLGVRFADVPSSTQRVFQAAQPNMVTGFNSVRKTFGTPASSSYSNAKPAFASMALAHFSNNATYPPLAYYETNTVLDSGASDHMCPWLNLLTYPTETYRQVIYPDSSSG